MTERTPSTEHGTAACRAPRHTRVQHLIAADEDSLVDLEVVLATLPLCSTGRVFIEVPDPSWIREINAPARMTVAWLTRSNRSGAPGSGRACPAGAAVHRAVIAWADEMLCEDGDDTRVILLGGYLGTADIVDHLTDVRGVAASSIRTPERFGLATAR
ncbi:SIP domain-containing protein [Microbacterium xanthum]|uniref:SIP domain-containing protein n=1 Tax=Microbacterium xanthum TaxID=3079794 RepID=UPI002AD3240D|nr:SIP domain-containing protein [Microbacterium sp. KSW-48]MDZ8171142.1 SIP domain-containing protein [Microbacterium sp. KSW-48]